MSRVIFKILRAVKGFPGIAYNDKKVKKEKAKLLFFANFPYHNPKEPYVSEKEARTYLELVSSKNRRIKFPQFHAIVSSKSRHADPTEILRIGMGIMEKMGYAQNPILAYLHNDTKNDHLHIITTRIDPNGKKISDKFEGIKANSILNDLLQLDYDKTIASDIKDVLTYHAPTISQYMLLFELKGYKVKSHNENLELFKYGKLLKKMPVRDLESSIKKEYKNNTNQIRALIYKYQDLYSSSLENLKAKKYDSSLDKLGSELTNFLYQRFGIQFIFFKAKGHEKPYGYAIIDHKNKAVFKGSEIMKLQVLTGEESLSEKEESTSNRRSETVINDPDLNNPNFDAEKLKQKYIPELPIETEINRIENEVEKDLSKEHDVHKRKRGRFI